MQIKTSFLLLTALSAGSAMARAHGHERRHQHGARAVGDTVVATIDGKAVSWANTYAGPTAAPVAPAPVVDAAATSITPLPVSSSSVVPGGTTTTTSGGAFPTGFGGQTNPTGSGDTYCGNLGNPYGSNIIRIAQSDLSKYDYTVTLDGTNLDEDYQIIFWNKCSQDDTLTGFFASIFPVSFNISAGKTEYVAVDSDTQGGFIGVPASGPIPRSSSGSVLGFWGEFDFADSHNNGWSGFDVSAIPAQSAGQTNFPGLKLEGNGVVSSITTNLGSVSNAYTSGQTSTGGIGGNIPAGPLALTATLNFSG